MQDFALTALGLVLLSLPAIVLVLAWRFRKRHGDAPVAWRKQVFTGALIGSGVSFLWFWTAILVLPRYISSEAFERIGWISQSFCLVFLVLSLAGKREARVFAALAAMGVAMLWVSVGFW